jgi:signal transduction histidine kinase
VKRNKTPAAGPPAAGSPAAGPAAVGEEARLRARIAALEELLDTRDRAVLLQAARLEEKTRILSSILESMSDGVAVIDETGRFVHFNPAAERLLGIGPVEGPPSAWPEKYRFFMTDQVTPFPADRLPLIRARQGESVDEEMIFVRHAAAGPDASRGADERVKGTWLSINSRPLRDENGTLCGAVSVLRNVTRRIESERERAVMVQELARSNAELDQFARVASHDLQEPLRMISGYTDLVARRYGDRLDPEARGFLAAVAGSVARMTELIQDLLALSRAGSAEVELTPIDSGIVCDRAIAGLQGAIEAEKAVVTRDPLPIVMADPTQLVQVFQNLISNAVKFHGDAAPRVQVAAKTRGREVVFSVRDEGIGIAGISLEEIFQSFRRLNDRGKYPGTGLGLAICRKVVERHGGRIWAESEPGKGATFFFSLPVAAGGQGRGHSGRHDGDHER